MMEVAYEADVRRAAQALGSAAADIRNKKNQTDSLAGQRTLYWKGAGADAFSREYGEISGNANELMRCIDRAGDALGRLPSLIARAERERSRAMEKKG